MSVKISKEESALILREEANSSIKRFFADKIQLHPSNRLGTFLTSQNVQIVLDGTDFDYSMFLVDQMIGKYLKSGKQLRHTPIHKDSDIIKLNLRLIDECRTHNIRKDFQGGIILLYYWLCEGLTV